MSELQLFVTLSVGILSVISLLTSIYLVAFKGIKTKVLQEKRIEMLEIDYEDHKEKDLEAIKNVKEDYGKLNEKLDSVVKDDIVPMKENLASMNAKLGILLKKNN